ncbi:unnamed protein product, partial [Didymodactylos carnosus]
KIPKLNSSQPYRQSLSYMIPILIFKLFGSLVLIFSNYLYLITKCCLKTLYNDDDTPTNSCCNRNTLWHLSTYVIYFSFRFLSFLLGVSCANRYSPRAVAYTTISSLSLIPSVILLILECIHFFRLWTYRPNNAYNRRLHRSRLCFIPFEITNDAQFKQQNISLCKQQKKVSVKKFT